MNPMGGYRHRHRHGHRQACSLEGLVNLSWVPKVGFLEAFGPHFGKDLPRRLDFGARRQRVCAWGDPWHWGPGPRGLGAPSAAHAPWRGAWVRGGVGVSGPDILSSAMMIAQNTPNHLSAISLCLCICLCLCLCICLCIHHHQPPQFR